MKSDGDKYELLGDPTEGALLTAALKAGFQQETLQKEHPRLAEMPFSSEKRYMATLHPWRDTMAVAYVKGSVDRVLAMSKKILENGTAQELTPEKRDEIEKINLDMASKALRVMALAYTECSSAPEKLAVLSS